MLSKAFANFKDEECEKLKEICEACIEEDNQSTSSHTTSSHSLLMTQGRTRNGKFKKPIKNARAHVSEGETDDSTGAEDEVNVMDGASDACDDADSNASGESIVNVADKTIRNAFRLPRNRLTGSSSARW